jgi:tetratricopeptide (TPR) repeat protein
MSARLTLALALVSGLASELVPASPPPSAAREAPGADRRSLQELLAEARAERERVQAELLPKVTTAVATLDALERLSRDQRAMRVVDELVGLGSDVAPLLVQYLDPGETASRAQIYRSEQVAEALVRLRSATITDVLLERAQSASLIGRLNALRVLGASPEPERVAPALEAIARAVVDEATNPFRAVRLAALRALARLGGPAAATILSETLRDGDLTSAEGALDALIEVRLESAAPHVVALLSTARGAALASRIAAYLNAVPTAIASEADVEALIRLCAQDSVSREAKLALLDVLRRGDHKPPSSVKRELQTLRESLDQGVRVAALVYLARQKDRAAKKELFDPWNAQVRDSRGAASALESRAQLFYLIGDHSSAVSDWRDALKAHEERPALRTAAPFIGLARSLAQLGKFKEASEYLDKAPISLTALHDLANDPDFAEMRTSKHVDVFRLDK